MFYTLHLMKGGGPLVLFLLFLAVPQNSPALMSIPGRPVGPNPIPRETMKGQDADLDVSRYALWTGAASAPILPLDKASLRSLDQVLFDQRRSAASVIPKSDVAAIDRDALASVNPAAVKYPPSAVPQTRFMGTFIKLELECFGTNCRNAVDAVAKKSGFSEDPRFPAMIDGQKAVLWGWVPSKSISELVRDPAVSRVEISDRALMPEAADDGRNRASMIVGLRLYPSKMSSSDIAEGIRRLQADAGFRLERVIGVQKIPASEDSALVVSGSMNVNDLSRVLAHPLVVKVMPSPDSKTSRRRMPRVPETAGKTDSSMFDVVGEHPISLLLGLLFLLALPKLARLSGRSSSFRRR